MQLLVMLFVRNQSITKNVKGPDDINIVISSEANKPYVMTEMRKKAP